MYYIIHNKTRNKTTRYEGSFPGRYLEEQLNLGDKLIVISLYSNTIKVPRKIREYNIVEWEWDDYPLIIK